MDLCDGCLFPGLLHSAVPRSSPMLSCCKYAALPSMHEQTYATRPANPFHKWHTIRWQCFSKAAMFMTPIRGLRSLACDAREVFRFRRLQTTSWFVCVHR